jgi:hypothetical protein
MAEQITCSHFISCFLHLVFFICVMKKHERTSRAAPKPLFPIILLHLRSHIRFVFVQDVPFLQLSLILNFPQRCPLAKGRFINCRLFSYIQAYHFCSILRSIVIVFSVFHN